MSHHTYWRTPLFPYLYYNIYYPGLCSNEIKSLVSSQSEVYTRSTLFPCSQKRLPVKLENCRTNLLVQITITFREWNSFYKFLFKIFYSSRLVAQTSLFQPFLFMTLPILNYHLIIALIENKEGIPEGIEFPPKIPTPWKKNLWIRHVTWDPHN